MEEPLRERGRFGDTLEEPRWELWRREGLHHAVVILCRDSFHVPGVLAVSALDAPGEGHPGFTALGRSQQLPGQGRMVAPGEKDPPARHPQDPTLGWEMLGLCVGGSWDLWCGLGAAGRVLLLMQQCLCSLVQLSHGCFIHPTGSAFLLLAPCHNTGSPSPAVQSQGLPSGSALPASPRACLPMAPGGFKKPFSHFSFLCAASPWAHAPAGPPTMLLPPALLCCLMPSCLHLVGPSPARDGSEHKRGGRSPISLCDPSWAPELGFTYLVEP